MPKRGCLKIIFVVCIGGLLFCATSVIAIQVQRTYSIAPFEKRFASNLPVLPVVPSLDILAPTQIGSFQRFFLDPQNRVDSQAVQISASYTNPDVPSNNIGIYISRLPAQFDKANVFQWANQTPDNVGGWVYINLNATFPFSYGSSITFSDRFVGVTWINGNYVLNVSGNRQAIVEFLSHYPY